jgi:hypothetical protein
MNRSTAQRVEKLERQQAEAAQGVEWDDDGEIVVLSGITHEEALKQLD